jgi:Tol biopolymer transport system component
LYASGYLLYVRDNTLMAQPFDPERGQLKGDPHRVSQNVAVSFAYGLFDISGNGILVYRAGGAREKRLTWFDRAGKNLGPTGEAADYYDVRLSPGGEKLASNAGYPAGSPNSEIWVDELARGVRMRLTIDPDTDHGIPVWSPDSSTIIFAVLQGRAHRGIYRKPSNGAGKEELLLPSENSDTQIWPTSWSRDARFILYSHGDISTGRADIWVLPLAGDRKPRLFVQVPAAAYDGQFSPNGRWVTYTSRESGRDEIYVVPFDAASVLNRGSGSPGASANGKWQISASGGHCPRWRKDGKEIFYLSPDNQILAAEVEEGGNAIEARPAQALFRAAVPPVPAISFSPFDVTPDGKRFVVNTLSEQNTPLTLVVNWTANLKKQ